MIEIAKIVELLKKELHSLYASQDHTHTSGGLRHTSSFRSVKAHESVSDLKVDVTIEALKNLLHWFDHQLDANTAEVRNRLDIIAVTNSLVVDSSQGKRYSRSKQADRQQRTATAGLQTQNQ